jgi:hypothetical protein
LGGDWFRLVRIATHYDIEHTNGRTDVISFSNYVGASRMDIDIRQMARAEDGVVKSRLSIELQYNRFLNIPRLPDFFLNLWKIELENRPDGSDLWEDYHRAQNLPLIWARMIRDACEAAITVITINIADLYQDPISTMNIVPGDYYITNYAPPPAALGTNSILSRRSLLLLLLSVPAGGVHLDPRKMVPIISILKIRIQYNPAMVNVLPPVGFGGMKRKGGPLGEPDAKLARTFSLGGGKSGKSKKSRRKSKSRSKKKH